MADTLDAERQAAVNWVAAALADPYGCGPEPAEPEELTRAAWATLIWLYVHLRQTAPHLLEAMPIQVLEGLNTERSLEEAGLFERGRFARLSFSAGPRKPRVMVPPGMRPAGSTRFRAALAAVALVLFTALALIGALVVTLVIIGMRSGT
jgi:hypothetical protein